MDTVQGLLVELSRRLRDVERLQWAEPVLVRAVNAALTALCNVMPSAHTVERTVELREGASQTLPVGLHRLVRVLHNVDADGAVGRPVTRVDQAVMDTAAPGWRRDEPRGHIRHWMQSNAELRRFDVWPPAPEASPAVSAVPDCGPEPYVPPMDLDGGDGQAALTAHEEALAAHAEWQRCRADAAGLPALPPPPTLLTLPPDPGELGAGAESEIPLFTSHVRDGGLHQLVDHGESGSSESLLNRIVDVVYDTSDWSQAWRDIYATSDVAITSTTYAPDHTGGIAGAHRIFENGVVLTRDDPRLVEGAILRLQMPSSGTSSNPVELLGIDVRDLGTTQEEIDAYEAALDAYEGALAELALWRAQANAAVDVDVEHDCGPQPQVPELPEPPPGTPVYSEQLAAVETAIAERLEWQRCVVEAVLEALSAIPEREAVEPARLRIVATEVPQVAYVEPELDAFALEELAKAAPPAVPPKPAAGAPESEVDAYYEALYARWLYDAQVSGTLPAAPVAPTATSQSVPTTSLEGPGLPVTLSVSRDGTVGYIRFADGTIPSVENGESFDVRVTNTLSAEEVANVTRTELLLTVVNPDGSSGSPVTLYDSANEASHDGGSPLTIADPLFDTVGRVIRFQGRFAAVQSRFGPYTTARFYALYLESDPAFPNPANGEPLTPPENATVAPSAEALERHSLDVAAYEAARDAAASAGKLDLARTETVAIAEGAITLADRLPLDQFFVQALLEYALYYCYSVDDDMTANSGRAERHKLMFFQLLNKQEGADVIVDNASMEDER